jgi:long-subunit acyl-CoA synthetase (AMP-forming)
MQIHLLKEPFSQDAGTLTTTMKFKRNAAKDMYKEEIKTLYSMPTLKK